MSNPLDDFLDRSFTCGSNDALRGQLRRQTSKVVRRHRLVRRALQMAALAACFLAGMATMWLCLPDQPVRVEQAVVVVEKFIEPPPRVETMPQTAAVAEVKARMEPAERVAQLR